MDPEFIKVLLFCGSLIALVVGVLVWVSRAERGALDAWEAFGRQRGMKVTRQGDEVVLSGIEEGRELTLTTKIEKAGNSSVYISTVECAYELRPRIHFVGSRSVWGRIMGKFTRRGADRFEQLYEQLLGPLDAEEMEELSRQIIAERGEDADEAFVALVEEAMASRDAFAIHPMSAEQRAALVRLREALGGAWVNVTVHASSSHLSISMVNMNRVMSPEKIEALWHVARPHVRRLIAVSRPKDDAEPAGW